jgi:hypothetical protein
MSAKCQKRTLQPSLYQAFGAVLVVHAVAAQMSPGASLGCSMPTRLMTPAICPLRLWMHIRAYAHICA